MWFNWSEVDIRSSNDFSQSGTWTNVDQDLWPQEVSVPQWVDLLLALQTIASNYTMVYTTVCVHEIKWVQHMFHHRLDVLVLLKRFIPGAPFTNMV